MLRVIVAGGREYQNYDRVLQVLSDFLESHTEDDIEVVCGCTRGADKLGERAAQELSLDVAYFPAEWDKYGRGAGPRRNRQMALYADVLIAFWDGESSGTNNMIHEAISEGLELHVYRYNS